MVLGCIVAFSLIFAILVLIPAVTNKFSATFVAELPDGRIFTGYITLEDGQVVDEENADGTDALNEEFSVEVKVRLVNSEDKIWKSAVNANIGDTVEFQIQYKNMSNATQNNVTIRDILPTNMEYVKGSTVLYNTDYPKGASVDQDNLVDNGIIIGNYAAGANAYIRFRAVVVDNTMANGANKFVNWGQVQAGLDKHIIQECVKVMVQKAE